MNGISNTDGVAFVFAASDSYSSGADYKFTFNNAGSEVVYTATGKTITQGTNAIIGLKIASSNFAVIDYTITKVSTTNGSFVTQKNSSDVTTANYNDVITVVATPNSSYEVEKVKWKKSSDSDWTDITSSKSFTMPAENVEVSVSFSGIKVTGISLNKTSITRGIGGSGETLTATVTPTNALNKSVTWSSSNTGVATVDSGGKVTVVAAGTATITATAADGSGKTATCSVTVLNGVEFTYNSATYVMSTDETSATWADANTWCTSKGSGWELPSKEVLLAIYNQKSTLNSALSACSGTQLGTGLYWSSTEYISNLAYGVYFYNGSVGNGAKSHSNSVRAVRAL